MTPPVHKAIILAAGRGTRMRRESPEAALTPEQERAARRGHKALMPVPRPFLDYQVATLARTGIREICAVIAPEQAALRDHLQGGFDARTSIRIAYQEEPLGTAHALAAAEHFAQGDDFLLLNSDNYYPPDLLRSLIVLESPGLVTLDRTRVLESGWGNLTDEKLSTYAVVTTDAKGRLQGMVEKPPRELWASLPEPVLVSINAWRLGPSIFPACRTIEPSARGEFEIQAAALWAMEHSGEPFQVVVSSQPILDLSSRADVNPVQTALAEAGIEA